MQKNLRYRQFGLFCEKTLGYNVIVRINSQTNAGDHREIRKAG